MAVIEGKFGAPRAATVEPVQDSMSAPKRSADVVPLPRPDYAKIVRTMREHGFWTDGIPGSERRSDDAE
ncbi:MAG: hypothetical protein NW216_13875 [Hyphomicrobium sp.]|nr:hypothetical protein [Hyphomicrobium sp.]